MHQELSRTSEAEASCIESETNCQLAKEQVEGIRTQLEEACQELEAMAALSLELDQKKVVSQAFRYSEILNMCQTVTDGD